eukprot:scaffold653946_cov59-Prasinocladus_malaysianus.AAC.1
MKRYLMVGTEAKKARQQLGYLCAAVLVGGVGVRRDDQDLVPCVPEPFDEALKAVLHAADVAEGRRLHKQRNLPLLDHEWRCDVGWA